MIKVNEQQLSIKLQWKDIKEINTCAHGQHSTTTCTFTLRCCDGFRTLTFPFPRVMLAGVLLYANLTKLDRPARIVVWQKWALRSSRLGVMLMWLQQPHYRKCKRSYRNCNNTRKSRSRFGRFFFRGTYWCVKA
jgi:hypothetical protein